MTPRPQQFYSAPAVAPRTDRASRPSLARYVMRHWLALTLVVGLAILHNTNAHAATSTAVIACTSCASVGDLQNSAATYFANPNAPIATIVYVISLSDPISMFFNKDCPNGLLYPCTAVISQKYYGTVAQESMAAAALDNATFARAAKFKPINAPSDITQTDEDGVITQYIQSQLVATGQTGISAWHLLTGFSNVVWYTLVNTQDGTTQQVFVGDTITINYPGGYSEKWQYLGLSAGTNQWKRVPNTLMLNGKPVTPPSTAPATPVPGAGGASGTNTWTDPASQINALANGWACYGTTTIIVDGVASTSSGTFTYPCQGG